MIFIVRLISRTFGQNVSKTAPFEHSLKKLFAETTLYIFLSKNFFVKTLVNSLFHSKSAFFKLSHKKFCGFQFSIN